MVTSHRGLIRLWLLIAVFIGGQLAMLAHAAEENHEAEPAGYVCQLCLAGHDLQGAVPPVAPILVPVFLDGGLPERRAAAATPYAFVVRRQARAPPFI